jgi:hypothetical protein
MVGENGSNQNRWNTKGGEKMGKMRIAAGTAAVAAFLMAGCTAQLSPNDKTLLNQALEASQSASMSAQKAETAASTAEKAAGRAEAAAARAESAAMKAETAAGNAATSADQAEQSAMKAQKAFEMGLKK